MMKRLIGAGGMLALVLVAGFWSAGSASADGGVHVQGSGATTDSCAGCHRAHTATADKLLKTSQTAICYTCHGATGTGATTAVETGTSYATASTVHGAGGSGGTGALRAGGFAYARINSTDASLPAAGGDSIGTSTILPIAAASAAQPVTSAHTVDGTAGTLWGNGALNSGAGGTVGSYNLACGSCHDPHGNGNFRTLRPSPTGSGAAAVNVPDETGPATTAPRAYSTTDYLRPFGGLTGTGAGQNISNWCATCHTRYLAGGSSSSGDTIFAFRHQVDTTAATSSAPECTTCHAAHGTNASSAGLNSGSVPWPGGGAATPATNSRLLKMDNRGICQKCHNR